MNRRVWLLVILVALALSGCASSGFSPLEAEEPCDACQRAALPETGSAWRDGRAICEECRASAVVDLEEATGILEEAREALVDAIGAEVVVEVGLRLADSEDLLAAAGDLAHPRLRAFCQIRETFQGETLVKRTFTIQVLRALPEDLLRGILAHELFHVWQTEGGAPEDARSEWREGSANWAQWEVHRDRGEDFWAMRIEQDPDPIYGAGFRKFHRLAEQLGTPGVLERVLHRRGF
ncbi:MAG: protein DA1 [Planctomycetes bacterium]|nr:protein DA1 [Planctomycetota bacterium]